MDIHGNLPWQITRGDGPLVATAIHDGHAVRPEIAERLAVDEAQRLREEDPHTGGWTAIAPTRIVGRRSRFEFDLNRPREGAVYLRPEDAWGIRVWREPLPDDVVQRSLALYDGFYAEVHDLLAGLVAEHGRVVVFDLHSYNHRRAGPDGPAADPAGNPDVNLGSESIDRGVWASVVEAFVDALGRVDYRGRRLDVRENVKFRGGHFPRWIHRTFPGRACALAVEVKKFFMDEWTGEAYAEHLQAVHAALSAAAESAIAELP